MQLSILVLLFLDPKPFLFYVKNSSMLLLVVVAVAVDF